MSDSFLTEDANPTERAIVKFFVCKKKLHTFTEDELNALPKAFLVYVAANAVKEIWEQVPPSWTVDPCLSELAPCDLYDHHKQVTVAKIPSIKQCSTCQLIKLYHGNKRTPELPTLVSNYHSCKADEEEEEDGESCSRTKKRKLTTPSGCDTNASWSWAFE